MVMGAIMASDMANAAGTYYTNNNMYQRYGSNSATAGRSYASKYGQKQSSTTTINRTRTTRTMSKVSSKKDTDRKQGAVVGLSLTHENASWNFDMSEAKSKLRYDGINWNVLDGNVSYYFGDDTAMQIKVGARYGKQFSDASMIDDDISGGGYLVTPWTNEVNDVIGYQMGHAISVGTSNGGSQYGFNAAFGLTDFFKNGNVKFTPSIGYRYLKYKLTTTHNYGVAVDTFDSTSLHTNGDGEPYITCSTGYMGELQCDPFLLFYSQDGDITITGRLEDAYGEPSEVIQVPSFINGSPVNGVSTGGTYYYEQSGTSHEYTTTWAGPYIALDMEYIINKDNAVSGSVELGLPVYTADGNQPYRFDWAHPKSVEDSSSFGDAMHIGLNALWKTSVSDATMLTLGFSYDYYTVSKATAKTYLNSTYYTGRYDVFQAAYNASTDEAERAYLLGQMNEIDGYRNAGWVLTSPSEISSVYKSMGIRVGLEMKF